MHKLYRFFCIPALSVVLMVCGVARAGDITGAGATLPALAFEKWANLYKGHTEFSLHYQSIGSGAGMKQMVAKLVDFGASEVPMSAEELNEKGLMQFPVLVGAIVPVVNIAGIEPGQLKLSGDVLADIFLGKITKWNDSRIATDNKGLALPDQQIAVVYRSDQSGVAFVFSAYLSQVSTGWKSNAGAGTSVRWPVGVGGQSNAVVASYLHRLQGSIGFVDYSTAMQNKMAYVQLKSSEGQFVSPSAASLKSAVVHATWDNAKDFGDVLVNQPGNESWPVTSTVFVFIYKTQATPVRGLEVLRFFDWAYSNGGKSITDLGYVPVPEAVTKLVREAWKAQVKDEKGHALWR